MILYADVLFLINFSMDFLGLFICSKIMQYKSSKLGYLLSSLIGAIYGVASMIIKVKPIVNVAFTIFIAMIMVIICFKEIHILRIFALTLMYVFVSATLSGIMSITYTLLNKILSSTIVNDSYVSYSGARTFIIIGLTSIVSLIFSRLLNQKKGVEVVDVSLRIKNSEYLLRGLCDSGNLLVEPFSGKKVILVSEESAIGKEILSFNEYKFKYIPFKDVSGEGILKGILPDESKVNDKQVDIIVATTKNKNFNGYDALVPKTVI